MQPYPASRQLDGRYSPAASLSKLDIRDPGSHRPGMCPTWTPGILESRRPGMCPTWTPGILGAADRECVQLGHRGSWEPPTGNVSNLDTGDSKSSFLSLQLRSDQAFRKQKQKEQERHIVALLFFLCLLA